MPESMTERMPKPWPTDGICFGGDYNPEQWPEKVWHDDVARMREAGVNLVSVGVFSWARLQPGPDRWDFGWLDRVMDLLHDGGVRVCLATATAAPPPWFSRAHPSSLPVDADGRTLWPGSRQTYCPSSPDYRRAATLLAGTIAQRYAAHPALAAWHVNNEYGCHVQQCYCDTSAAAFRGWLRTRYGDLDAVNDAWGTAFWGQIYGDWEEIQPPRAMPAFPNPCHRLDYQRFSSDALLEIFRAERDAVAAHSPGVPATTNFMVMQGGGGSTDSWKWAPELDIVANDHYLDGPDPHVDIAMSGDMMRGLARGGPWLLLEHSTGAVNWRRRNHAKPPGQLRRDSLGHVARGADGVMFFQWRASRSGTERFFSAMLPHAGADSAKFREVAALGAELGSLREVTGSRVEAEAALVWDYDSWWAHRADTLPATDLDPYRRSFAAYRALWEAGVTCDTAHPGADLSAWKLVLVPSLYLVSDASAANLAAYVEGGGHVVVGYFSGIVDECERVRTGGFPGAFRDLLGVRTEEFFPLEAGQRIALTDGGGASDWAEMLQPRGAEVLSRYVDGPLPGVPAVTRHRFGAGTAWYLATELDRPTLASLTARVVAEAGVARTADVPAGVEAVRRRAADGTGYLFLLNHTAAPAHVPARGRDLLTGRVADGVLTLPAGDVAVVREPPDGPLAPS